MRDIVFVAIALAFFGLCYLYVLGCNRIVGGVSPPDGSANEPDRSTSVTDQADTAVMS